jgi:hypothetical protein
MQLQNAQKSVASGWVKRCAILLDDITMLRGLCLPVNTLGVTSGTGWGGILGGDVGCTMGGRG